MYLILRIILLIGVGYFSSTIMPWWNIVLLSFLIGFIFFGNGFSSFVSGFIGGGLLWLGYAWKVDIETNHIMSRKIVNLLPMVNDITYLLILTAGLGGIVAGFGMVTGNSFRQIFSNKKKTKGLYSS